MTIYIFTDGSSFNNRCKDASLPQISSSGFVILNGDTKTSRVSINEDTDINHGEIQAIYNALYYVKNIIQPKDHTKIILLGDNQYSIKGLSEWMYSWMRNKDKYGNWRNSSNNIIQDQKLFKKIYQEFIMDNIFDISFYHIRGHFTKGKKKCYTAKFNKQNNTNISPNVLENLAKYNNEVDVLVRDYLMEYVNNYYFDKKFYIHI